MHVYEPGYPLAATATATFSPPHAPASTYRAVQRALGLGRAVVVQPTGYGFDNRCARSATEQLGPQARAVAIRGPMSRSPSSIDALDCIGDDARRRRILVDHPADLCDFLTDGREP